MGELERVVKQHYEFFNLIKGVGVGIGDLNGNVYYANNMMQKLTGYSQDEWRKLNLQAIFTNPKDIMLLLNILQNEGKISNHELELKRKDGTVYIASISVDILKIMDEKNLKTISFPAISTGIFGYPIDRCAKIMISTTKEYLKGDTQIEQVIFCLYTSSDFGVFEKELN